MNKLLVTIALIPLITGCANYGKLTANLKDDPAIVVLNVGTPWGVQKLVRVGGQTNGVEVSPDGTVKIAPPPPPPPPAEEKKKK